MWDFGEIREISDEDILNSLESYPSWMVNLIGRSGTKCSTIILDKEYDHGVYLGLAEDDYDYYYQVFTKRNGEYKVILETCCSEIKFIDEFSNSEFSDELMREYNKYLEEKKS